MNRLILATGADTPYIARIKPYLDSVEQHSNFDLNYLVHISDTDMKLGYEMIDVAKLSPSLPQCWQPNWPCVQHGDFLHSPTLQTILNPTDVVVFTDGDMLMQRPLNDSELMLLRTLQDGEVLMGMNAHPNDTLKDEAERIQPTAAFRLANVPDQHNMVYNGGVIVMQVQTWLRFYSLYRGYWPTFEPYFNHYAKGQWLISWILGHFSFDVKMQPLTFHQHNHYPTQPNTHQDEHGNVYHNGELTLFKHFQPYGHRWNTEI